MGLFIVAVLVALSTMIYIIVYEDGDLIGWVIGFFLGLVGFIVTALIGVLISFTFNTVTESKADATVVNVEAIKDNSNIEGSFFLGSGYIDENQYYFYVESTEKGKRINKLSTSEVVYINEVKDTQPRLETYEKVFTSSFAKFMFGKVSAENSEYIFYLPEDTVTTEFNIDME